MNPKLYQIREFALVKPVPGFVGTMQSLPLRALLYNGLRMVAQVQGRNSGVSAYASFKYYSGSMALFIFALMPRGLLLQPHHCYGI